MVTLIPLFFNDHVWNMKAGVDEGVPEFHWAVKVRLMKVKKYDINFWPASLDTFLPALYHCQEI